MSLVQPHAVSVSQLGMYAWGGEDPQLASLCFSYRQRRAVLLGRIGK